MSEFKKYKGRKGAVTVVKKDGPYDLGGMSKSLDSFAEAREGLYKGDDKYSKEAKKSSILGGFEAIKKVKREKSESKGRKDFPFFKHTTKGK